MTYKFQFLDYTLVSRLGLVTTLFSVCNAESMTWSGNEMCWCLQSFSHAPHNWARTHTLGCPGNNEFALVFTARHNCMTDGRGRICWNCAIAFFIFAF